MKKTKKRRGPEIIIKGKRMRENKMPTEQQFREKFGQRELDNKRMFREYQESRAEVVEAFRDFK